MKGRQRANIKDLWRFGIKGLYRADMKGGPRADIKGLWRADIKFLSMDQYEGPAKGRYYGSVEFWYNIFDMKGRERADITSRSLL